jgi:hypothetical protein
MSCDRLLHTTETSGGDTDLKDKNADPLIAGDSVMEANIMNPPSIPTDATSIHVHTGVESVPKLIGQIYATAPLTLRARIIEQLMRPLGVLGLTALANGVFASIRLRERTDWLQVAPEDARSVRPSDVVALADWSQQVSNEAIVGLGKIVTSSPMLASTAAAAVLVGILMRRSADTRSTGCD